MGSKSKDGVKSLQAVEKLFYAFIRHSSAGGNPVFSKTFWMPVFTGMTTFKHTYE